MKIPSTKLIHLLFVFSFMFIYNALIFANEMGGQEPIPVPKSTALPGIKPHPDAGLVSLLPAYKRYYAGDDVIYDIYVNSGHQVLAFFDFELSYDSSILQPFNSSKGPKWVMPGADGFKITKIQKQGQKFKISGLNTRDIGPGQTLHLLTLRFSLVKQGTGSLKIKINSLNDPDGQSIGNPRSQSAHYTVGGVRYICSQQGDGNGDGQVNILDALLCAQFCVGLNPKNIRINCINVDCNNKLDMADALLIAQYSVGMKDNLGCRP